MEVEETIGIMIEEKIEMIVIEGVMVQGGQNAISVESLDILLETVAKKREELNAIVAIKKGT